MIGYNQNDFQDEAAVIQIIGAGFGRTGTLSLKTALEILGYDPCYHMEDVFFRPWQARAWRAACRGRSPNWERLLGGQRAIVDWPGCTFYPQLIEHYPQAKVILTVRDPQAWYASVAATIYPVMRRFPLNELGRRLPLVGEIPKMLDCVVWQGTFAGRFEDRTRATAIFEAHNRQVIERVAPERLLVYDIRSGWEPLCAFLGRPAPEGVPFPHTNDRDAYWKRVKRLTAAVYLGLAAGGAMVGWGASRLLRCGG